MKIFSFLLVFVFSFGLFGNVFGEIIFQDDFENEVLNKIPSKWENGPWSDAGTNFVTDKVSHTGTKSLVATSFQGGQKGLYAPSSLYQGDQIVELFIYLPSGGVNNQYFGGFDYAGLHVTFKYIGNNTAEMLSYSNDGVKSITTVNTEQWQSVKVEINWSGQSYKLIINGVTSSSYSFTPVTDGGWNSGFSVRGDNNSGPRTVYFDDIKISTGTTSCTSAEAGTISANLDVHMPSLDYQGIFGKQNLWVDFEYYGEGSNGELLWKLKDYGAN